MVLQQYPQAEVYYKRAIELDPAFLPTYLNLAELYRMENQLDSAMRVLRQAMQRQSQSGDGVHGIGQFLSRPR